MVYLANRFTIKCIDVINGSVIDYDEDFDTDTTHCACTYFINTRKCDQESAIRIIFKVMIAYMLLVSITSLCFLYYRWAYRCRPLPFEFSNVMKCFFRPKPNEAFHICAFIFGLTWSIHAILILYDAYPSISWAFVGASLPRIIAFSLGAVYTIGITNLAITLYNSREHVYLLNYRVFDTLKFFYLLAPALSILPLTWLWGYHLDIDETYSDLLKNMALAHDGLWAVYLVSYMICLVYFWFKMRGILKIYMEKAKQRMDEQEEPAQLKQLKSAATHFMIIVFISVVMIIVGVTVDTVHERFNDSSYLFEAKPYVLYSAIALLQTPFFTQIGQLITLSSEYHTESQFRRSNTENTQRQQVLLSPYPTTPLQSPLRTFSSHPSVEEALARSTITIPVSNKEVSNRTSKAPLLLSTSPNRTFTLSSRTSTL